MKNSTDMNDRELFQRCLDGIISPSEQEALWTSIGQSSQKRFFVELLEIQVPAAPLCELPASIVNHMVRSIMETSHGRSGYRLFSAHFLGVIMLSLFVLAGIGGLFFPIFKPISDKKDHPIRLYVSDSGKQQLPQLILADGSSKVLQDLPFNTVLMQGSQTLYQRKGLLTYSKKQATGSLAYNRLSIPKGCQYQIQLSDGSLVWLNAGSELKYPVAFGPGERKVFLEGQAYFDIKPDSHRPFKVGFHQNLKNSKMEIMVLGTQFDVMAYADEPTIQTTLVKGNLVLQTGQTQQKISPGQRAIWHSPKKSIEVETVDIRYYLDWRMGLIEFQNKSLKEILRLVNRYYDVNILCPPNVDFDQPKFSGGFNSKLPLDMVLKMLAENGVNLKQVGNHVWVLPY